MTGVLEDLRVSPNCYVRIRVHHGPDGVAERVTLQKFGRSQESRALVPRPGAMALAPAALEQVGWAILELCEQLQQEPPPPEAPTRRHPWDLPEAARPPG